MNTPPSEASVGELAGLKVLLLSYFFPPLASAGGHRTGALARHMSRLGAEVTVITARHGIDASDPALVDKLPPEVKVVRVPSLEGATLRAKARDRYKHEQTESDESEATPPPPAVRRAVMAAAWSMTVARSFNPWATRKFIYGLNAKRAVRKQIKRDRPDVLLVSLGPMVQSWAGVLGARGTGVPVVFDFRDLWTPAPEYYKNFLEYPITRPVRLIDRPIERWTMRRADFFVANHAHMERTMNELEPHTAGRTVVVPNGFEDEDFTALPSPAAPGPVKSLRSMGTTYIGSVPPLLQAVSQLPKEIAEQLKIELIGPYYDTHEGLESAEGSSVLDVRAPLPHKQALIEMAESDVLLFLLRDTPGIDDQIPARLYEYLRLGKPILALAPSGAAQELVARHGGKVIHPTDSAGLAQALTEIARGELPGSADPSHPEIAAFERGNQALTLGRALRELAAGR
ncbi:MAG TPA: glycosyltransferase [Solirubrobacterales bacterium]|nr:glycosyltransferase [Solirubrobacterales bacterium]